MKRALVYTRRPELPVAIQQIVKALGIETKVLKDGKVDAIQAAIAQTSPNFILIDGDFEPGDAEKIRELNSAPDADIRLAFLRNQLPGSVKLLRRVKTAAANVESKALIFFFVDDPKDVLKKQLSDSGASMVYRSLDKPSEVETGLFDATQDAKKLVGSAVKLGRSVGNRISRLINMNQ